MNLLNIINEKEMRIIETTTTTTTTTTTATTQDIELFDVSKLIVGFFQLYAGQRYKRTHFGTRHSFQSQVNFGEGEGF